MSKSRTLSFEHYIPTEDGDEITLTIEALAYPYEPAGSPEYRGGPPMEPPQDAWIELLSIKRDGIEIEPSDEEIKNITEAAWDHIPEPHYDERD